MKTTLLLEENHDLPLCRLQFTTRGGSTSDAFPIPTAAQRPVPGLCNFASELQRRGAGERPAQRWMRRSMLWGRVFRSSVGTIRCRMR